MGERCSWASSDLLAAYHDAEWGVPVRDERTLFELLTLEGAQAGLSWETVLKKREGYRRAFAGFDIDAVARFGSREVERLLGDASIIRNRLKIESTIENARATIALRVDGGLATHLWSFVNDEPIVNRWTATAELPSETGVSKAISKDLKKRGFRFVGPTIIYALMQAIGMVNDHVTTCPRHAELSSS